MVVLKTAEMKRTRKKAVLSKRKITGNRCIYTIAITAKHFLESSSLYFFLWHIFRLFLCIRLLFSKSFERRSLSSFVFCIWHVYTSISSFGQCHVFIGWYRQIFVILYYIIGFRQSCRWVYHNRSSRGICSWCLMH